MVGQARRRATKIQTKVVGGGIFCRVFSNFEKSRHEVADDIISRVAVEYVGMDVQFKIWLFYGKQWPSYSTLWPAEPVLRTFVQYLIAFCSRPETDSDVLAGKFLVSIVPDKLVEFRDPRLNRSREIKPNAAGGDIFDGLFRDNF